jgi:hypothetical protein
MTASTIATLVFVFTSLGGEVPAVMEVVDIATAVEVVDIAAAEGLSIIDEVLIAIKPGLEKKINTSVRYDRPKGALCRNS